MLSRSLSKITFAIATTSNTLATNQNLKNLKEKYGFK